MVSTNDNNGVIIWDMADIYPELVLAVKIHPLSSLIDVK